MADKLLYIPDNDTQNYPFCRLKLVVETLKPPINEVPKVVEPTNKNYKTLGASVINSPLSPLSLCGRSSPLNYYDILNGVVYYNVAQFAFMFYLYSWREGTLDCKLHWYPKFYNPVILFVGLKALSTFN